MTERWELLELIGQTALRDSDTNLPISTAEAILDAVEPIIRADERERMQNRGMVSILHTEQVLADLRVKVEDEMASPREFDEWTDGWNAAKRVFLALLPKEES